MDSSKTKPIILISLIIAGLLFFFVYLPFHEQNVCKGSEVADTVLDKRIIPAHFDRGDGYVVGNIIIYGDDVYVPEAYQLLIRTSNCKTAWFYVNSEVYNRTNIGDIVIVS